MNLSGKSTTVLKRQYCLVRIAKNTERMESDIDLAIVFDKLNDEEKFDIQVQLIMLAFQIDYRIESHPFSKEEFYSNNPFTAEIKRTGIELSCEVSKQIS